MGGLKSQCKQKSQPSGKIAAHSAYDMFHGISA